MPEVKAFEEVPGLSFMEYGKVPVDLPLQLLTTYPQGAGFPFFTWAQLFFTNADQVTDNQDFFLLLLILN